LTTLAKAWTRYDLVTKQASDQARLLAVAGVGAVWLFTGANTGSLDKITGTPRGFVLAGIFFAAAVAIDLLQYIVGSIVLRHWIHEVGKQNPPADQEIGEVPDYVSGVPRWMYYGKASLLFIGYGVFAWTVGIAYFKSA
jgi:hypothetical protein